VSRHDELRELIGAVALGAATADEEAALERHAATCHKCRAELDSSRVAAAQLAFDVPQLDPPPDLKSKVMAAVREDSTRRSVTAPPPRRRLLWPAIAGALAVLAAALVVWNVTLQRGDGTREIAISGTDKAPPGVTGRLVIAEDGTAVIRVSNLPELAPGRSYELWTIRNGQPYSQGFAARTAGGDVVVATADLAGATVLALTPEPRTNTVAPTGEQLVVVNLRDVA
jgi:anti-sigma-K factor RskA